MKIERFKEILKEEIEAVLKEASITRRFSKAVEAYRTIQLKQQDLRKKFVGEKDPKKKEALKQALIDLHKKVQKAESDFNAALRIEPVDLDEANRGKVFKAAKKGSKLNEDVFKSFQSDIPGSKIEIATNTDNVKTVQARMTNKTWDDGVPVLKYIARAPKKPSPLPKGKFKIIDDSKYGWWYYQVGNTWYGIRQKDYGTPPFEY
mgnify:CR=1 FL=1